MRFSFGRRRRFADLDEQEIVALAISAEEDDARIYRTYAEQLRANYPHSAAVLDGMAEAEDDHRQRLIDLHKRRFGDVIPLLRPEHMTDYPMRRPVWLVKNLGIERIRHEALAMEEASARFYQQAMTRAADADTRKLLGDLARIEADHEETFLALQAERLTPDDRSTEDAAAHRQFLLTYVQPGLAGLMDGSVATLAPIFAAAFATGDTWATFLVGMAASVGAGISMGLAEAISDDGKLSGRGSPVRRGIACGVMTTVGGLGHTLPYLIAHFWTATSIAMFVVFLELWAIAWIQNRFMNTPFFRAALQIVLGGALVFAAGVLIGSG